MKLATRAIWAGVGCGKRTVTLKPTILKLAGLFLLLLLCRTAALGAPFAEEVPFTQPDGTQITLWGQGDEFHAVFETLDGYTVMFNQQTRAYDYAALSADGDQLVSTGVAVGQGSPSALGLKQHLRINPEAARKQAAERFARWDQAMGISQRWNALKAEQRAAELSASETGEAKSPPSSTTIGQKLGLTLLIDFSDAVGTVARAEIFNYCNGDSYTGYGNNGSVKKYYLDNSNNLLTYSNVVTIYIRVPQPKTYYNNTTNDCGIQGRALITDAINAMKALTNYATDILPTFSALTVDGSSRVVACNVFFAGANSGVWSYGLWPHSWVLASSVDLGNGKKVYKYQITNIGTSLSLGTFCHENGHMLCGFPDIYDYGYDSTGGAGMFCLMNSGGSGGNPVQVCAYLKRAAGWATTVTLTSNSVLTASVSSSGTDFNKFYRYAKPGVSTEYFLVENRQKSGRDANLPASGVAIWHVDELGDKDNQSTNFNTSHLNYEVSLMQADNLWHFQRDVNSGDSKDLYYLGNTATGYANRFSDATSPSARWWSGASSGLSFHHFSASGSTMTFSVSPEGPIITVQPTSLAVNAGANATFQVTATGTAPLAYQWRFNGTNLAGAVNSALTLTNLQMAQAGTYAVLVTNNGGSVLSANALLTVRDPWIVTQPQSQAVVAGAPATFTVSAGGTPPLSYQWLKEGIALVDGTNVNGAHTATLTVAQVQASDLGSYSVAVNNPSGQVVSSNAILTGAFPPVILTQPASQAVPAGSVVSFTAGVSGGTPMGFQWRRAGTNLVDGGKLSGSASASLIVSNAQGFEMGNYVLVVTNAHGSVTSSNAQLALWPLVAWGRNNYDQANIPGGLNNVTGIAGGIYHSLALRADGTVAAWGAGSTNTGVSPYQGQAIVPSGLSNAIQVAGGYYHSLALKSDGTMAAWGAGTTDIGAIPHFGQAMVPAGLSNVIAVAAGGYQSLALKADGTVFAWGAGTTNTGASPQLGQALVPAGLSNVVAVSAGGYHSMALKSDGTVVAWGAGATGTGSIPHYGQALVPIGLSNVVAVAAGGNHSVALQSDGTVVAWGDNTYGQTNTPASLSNVVAIAAGRYDSLALQSDGTMVAWGDNLYGQAETPVGLGNVVSIAGGGFHTLALESDGRPLITVQPLSQTVPEGTTVRVQAMAVGLSPLSYQWQRNGINVAGETTSALTFTNLQCSDTGAYTLLVSNSLGSTSSSTASLAINDTTPPSITCPSNMVVSANSGCNATNVALGSPVTGDDCGVAEVTHDGLASYPLGTNLVTWTVTDSGGNSNSCVQWVIVLDTEPPVLVCATNKTVECGSAWSFDPPEAFDACSGTNVTVTLLGVETNGACPEVITATWLAVDACGNTNTCSQNVTNLDLTPPVLVCATNKTVECSSTWSFDPPEASDTCSGTNVTVTLLGVETNGACPEVITATWMAADACGNTNACSQSVTNVDLTPPVLVCATNKTVENGTAWSFDPPEASDVCSGTNVTVTLLGVETNGTCPEVITATWLAADACGNTNTCSQSVTNVDLTPPLLVCATNKTVECGSVWSFDPPEASDACGATNVAVTLLGVETNGTCPEVITATWLAADACGNTNTCSQSVTNVDLTPPVLVCATNKTVECGSVWNFDPPEASDTCSGTNVAVSLVGVVTNGVCPGVITATWVAVDACGNSNTCSQSVTKVAATSLVANFAADPTNGVAPLTVVFTNLSDGAIDYAWDFGDGNLSTNANPVNTYTNPGAYSVSLTAIGPGGTDTLTLTNYIAVTPLPLVLPVILQQPLSLIVTQGQDASFTVVASGAEPLHYQWRLNGGNLSGATNPALVLTGVTAGRAGAYSVAISNPYGSTNSSDATLSFQDQASFSFVNPGSISIPIVGTATPYPSSNLVSGVAGSVLKTAVTLSNLSHAWPDDLDILLVGPAGQSVLLMTDCGGETSLNNVTLTFDDDATSSLPDVSQILPGAYRPTDYGTNDVLPSPAPDRPYGTALSVFNGTNPNGAWRLFARDEFANDSGTISDGWSLRITVTVPSGPVIWTQPADQSVAAGRPAELSVAVGGSPPLYWQWRKDGLPVSLATNAVFALANVQCGDAGSYDVVVTNIAGSVTSSPVAVLTVVAPPTITSQPADQMATVGQTVTFSVDATNDCGNSLAFQWRREGANLAGATDQTCIRSNVQLADAGGYRVVITNLAGSITSAVAVLSFVAPPSDFTADRTNGVAPLTVAFTNLSSGATDYVWDFGDGNLSTNVHPANTYTNPGVYSVSLMASGPSGTNALTRTNYIVVTPVPLVLTCATNKTVECGQLWDFDPPTASGNCSEVLVSVQNTVTNTGCGNSFSATRTWQATDACTNNATCSQTVTNLDTTPPALVCATNKAVEHGAAWSFDPPEASDTCSGTNVTVTLLGVETNGALPEVITATWVATDACGNTNACSQTVTNLVSTPPIILTVGSPEWLPDIGVRLTVLGNITGSITIQWTEELTNALSNWPTLTTFSDFTGATQYLDAEATNLSRRFYRAVAP